MEALSINYESMDWGDARGYPPGTQIKYLRKSGHSETFLLKLPAGFSMQDHAHISTEQHFVLQGDYISDGQSYGVGSYRLIPAHANHGPFVSKNGALVLVVHTD